MTTATIHASAVLRRRAIAQDGLGIDHDDAYWAAAPRLYDFSKHQLNLKPHNHHPDPDDLKPDHADHEDRLKQDHDGDRDLLLDPEHDDHLKPDHHDDRDRLLDPEHHDHLKPDHDVDCDRLLNPEHDDDRDRSNLLDPDHGHLKPDPDDLKQEHDPAPHPDTLPPPPAPSPSPSPPPPSPPRRRGPTQSAHLCLLALQDTGLEWGVRKRVHYVARNRAVNHHAHDRRARPFPAPPAVVADNHGRSPPPHATPAAVVAESAGEDGRGAAPAVKAAAEGDEASSSNVKTKDLLGLLEETEAGSGSGQEVPAAAAEEVKAKKRRRKNGRGRGFSMRPRKRTRKTATAPKVEVLEEAMPPKAEEETEVVAMADQGTRKRKDARRPGRAVAKRPKKESLPLPEEVERKVPKAERKMNLPLPVPEETRTVKKRGLLDGERAAVKVVVAVKRERKSKTPLCARRVGVMKEEPETRPVRAVKAEKPVKAEEATATAPALRGKVDRWAATRYAACEASLVGILRRFGARAGKPVPRGTLRQEARKHVGDTGLLDHLLKHTADKVPRGCAERIRRRHNADGAMEYWLEPAELMALRREVGVDPYWVPPPGWKRGDPVSAEGYALKAKRQVEELTAELAGVKRHMKQLLKAQQGTMKIEMKPEAAKAYISNEPHQEKYECVLKANGNLEKQVLSLEEKYASTRQANGKLEEEVLFLKENYEAVLEKNSRMEQQLAALSTSFLTLKEGMRFLNDGEQQQLRIMGPEQRLLLCAKEECAEADDLQESNGGGSEASGHAAALAVGAGHQIAGGKRSGPDAAQPSTPPTPGAAFMDDGECEMGGGLELPPTPPSASSTNAAAAASPAKLLLLPAPDSPSPVQAPPQPPASCSSPRDAEILESAPTQSGSLDLQRKAPSLPSPCGLPEAKTTGGSVGTELALATPTY